METTTEKKKSRSILLWILIILAPVIAGWLIGLVSGTNPLRLDAWNTSWNDEVGYYRVVRIMHYYGVPQGMTGFNEITSGNVPFGPYNVFTYIPYYLVSFVTGCTSHNYIYFCNIAMAVLANILFAALVRPERKQALLTALFFLTQLIAARYTWSGMAEASYHFYIVVFMGLVIWYLKNTDASGLKKMLNRFGAGKLTYSIVAAKEIAGSDPGTMRVRVDGEKCYSFPKAYFAAVMNQPYEGGGLMLCPSASACDGLLDLFVCADMPRTELVTALPFTMYGLHRRHAGVHFMRGRHFEIFAEQKSRIHLDGEAGELSHTMDVSLEKEKLRVIVR